MATPLPLPLWDRRSGQLIQEFMDDSKSTYESKPHRSLNNLLESHPVYDWVVARYQNTRRSARKIEPFVRKHGIDMSEFQPGPYKTYAEFFERAFRPGVRTFPEQPGSMGAFGEARYFGWDKLDLSQQFPIKGHSLSPEHLLGNKERAKRFEGGPVILARLSPVDYHHLHFPDDGTTLEHERLGHRLWTVNQNALRNQPNILFRNERNVHILQTTNFGILGFAEIGALSVGRIVNVHPLDKPFNRGMEKSVFRFGGSAVALFGEHGRWRPSEDIMQKTREGIETYVRLGEPIAERCDTPRSSLVGNVGTSPA
jgi:phosphatidylserine decarboxylase